MKDSPLIDPKMTEAMKEQERIANDPNAKETGQSRLQRMFGKKKKIRDDMPILDIKGNRINYSSNPDVSQGAIERQLYAIDKGPKMLPRKTRFRVWAALIGIVGWFFSCFCLIAYRLRSDDLELMEREVYEELRVKKDVERFMAKSKGEDDIMGSV